MATTSNQRDSWFSIASCAIAVAVIVVIVETTDVNFEGAYSEEHKSVGAGLTSNLDNWVWPLYAVVAAGVVLAVAALKGSGERRWIAWFGLTINALLALLITVFLAFAYSQGAFQ